MSLVLAVLAIAYLARSTHLRRALSSESLIAVAAMGIAVFGLFELDRLG